MSQFSPTRVLAISAFAALFSTAVMAHDGQNHLCHDQNNNPVGYGNSGSCCYDPQTDGPENKNAYPYCPAVLDRAAGGEQYGTLDRSTLAHTHICPAGQNCGAPIQLGELTEFYGTAGGYSAPVAPVAAPVAVIPAAAPTIVAAAPAVVAAAPAVVTGGLTGVGFGGAGLIAAGLGAAAIVGIGIAIANDNDSASSTSRTTR